MIQEIKRKLKSILFSEEKCTLFPTVFSAEEIEYMKKLHGIDGTKTPEEACKEIIEIMDETKVKYLPRELMNNIFSYLPYEKTYYLDEYTSKKLYDPSVHTIKWAIQQNDLKLFDEIYSKNTPENVYVEHTLSSYGQKLMLSHYINKYNEEFPSKNIEYCVLAVRNNNMDFVHMFIDEYKDILYDPALEALDVGNLDLFKFLLDNVSEQTRDSFNYRILNIAIENNDYEVVKILLDKGVDITSEQELANPSIVKAGSCKDINIIKMMIDRGWDINSVDSWGYSALLTSFISGNRDISKLLIFKGADVNVADYVDHVTCLMYACADGDVEIVNMLLINKADVNKVDIASTSAMHYAAKNGRADVISIIFKYGADVNALDYHGDTPLIYAMSSKSIETVKTLLSLGADKTITNKYGKNALHYARYNKDIDMIHILGES